MNSASIRILEDRSLSLFALFCKKKSTFVPDLPSDLHRFSVPECLRIRVARKGYRLVHIRDPPIQSFGLASKNLQPSCSMLNWIHPQMTTPNPNEIYHLSLPQHPVTEEIICFLGPFCFYRWRRKERYPAKVPHPRSLQDKLTPFDELILRLHFFYC